VPPGSRSSCAEIRSLTLNPYLNALLPDTNLRITDIDIYCRNPNPGPPPPPPPPAPGIAQINFELDGPYSQEWNFRNQPQKIGMAMRICIRYQINGGSAWAEDYLLVGYGGGMGG
jgi:hypothetical protein